MHSSNYSYQRTIALFCWQWNFICLYLSPLYVVGCCMVLQTWLLSGAGQKTILFQEKKLRFQNLFSFCIATITNIFKCFCENWIIEMASFGSKPELFNSEGRVFVGGWHMMVRTVAQVGRDLCSSPCFSMQFFIPDHSGSGKAGPWTWVSHSPGQYPITNQRMSLLLNLPVENFIETDQSPRNLLALKQHILSKLHLIKNVLISSNLTADSNKKR